MQTSPRAWPGTERSRLSPAAIVVSVCSVLVLVATACGSARTAASTDLPGSTSATTTSTTFTVATTTTTTATIPTIQQQTAVFSTPDPASLMATVEELASPAYRGRLTGSEGAELAAQLIESRLASCPAVEPLVADSYRVVAEPDALPEGWPTPVVNLAAKWPGSGPLADQVILLSAHYDHLGETEAGDTYYPGAVDNAGGVAALLSMACSAPDLLVNPTPRRTIVFVFFDAEEAGLVGSSAWVARPPFPLDSIAAQVNLDGFGAPLFGHLRDGIAIGADLSDELAAEIVATNDADGAYSMHPAGHEVLEGRGDHAPFQAAGVVSVMLATGIPPGTYHTPSDTIDVVDASVLADATRWTGDLVLRLAGRTKEPTLRSSPRAPYEAAVGIESVIATLEAHPEDMLGPSPAAGDLETLRSSLQLGRAFIDPWLTDMPRTDKEWDNFTAALALVSTSFTDALVG